MNFINSLGANPVVNAVLGPLISSHASKKRATGEQVSYHRQFSIEKTTVLCNDSIIAV